MTESIATVDRHKSTLQRLAEFGLTLPSAAVPVASYVPAVRAGNVIYTSGQLPLDSGSLIHTGKVGSDVSVHDATVAARICTLNALAAIGTLADLDSIVRVVKVVGFVASAPGFNQQPSVINGASDLLVATFGNAGKHARSAIGVAELPLNSPVEVEMIVEIRST
ncbi:RidA family protein [Mycobacterium sp. 3519A]|jgi:enamine deaminase RidA (YjgF/YER057c/UK114 family)|uniref:RidA family protein n=1 Tax=Mycobacterium sp. 3519A TaxID=2057184 RepID=UPI000C7C8424|nr:RidA family protein [Mycobacterium sp. 3519A]